MRVAALALAAVLIVAPKGHAFVVEAPGAGSGDPTRDLVEAARWDMSEGSLIATAKRGLGGGLEYAIDDSVCARLNFADAPDCAAIKAQIVEAMARWGAGHPSISFTDVTGAIAPKLAPAVGGWAGAGAEIDFFAVSGSELTREHGEGVAADTRRTYLFAPAPRDPQGRVQADARGRITAADVRLNADICFHLDPDVAAPGCVHFGSVVMHEIAHVLGLDHPDAHPERNLDDDGEPGEAMALDCTAPGARLAASPRTERHAVANGRWTGSGYWTRGLTYDDVAGRNALYPDCGASNVAAADASGGAGRWAAFALAEDGGRASAFGWSRDASTQDDARASATEACARQGASCVVAAVFTDCFAFARDATGAWGWAVRAELSTAQTSAVANCARNGASCAAPIAICAAPEREPRASAIGLGLRRDL
jgi:hypothetical protein